MNTNAYEVREGSIIGYLLTNGNNPERIWCGRVLRIYSMCVLVESTEAGYEGMNEYVLLHQIVTTPERVIVEAIPTPSVNRVLLS